MMTTPKKLTESEVSKALPLPKVGEVIKGKKVRAVQVVDSNPGVFTVGILFEKGVRRKDLPAMLPELFNAHHITIAKEDYTVSHKDYIVRLHKDGVQMIMALQITPAVLNNPGKLNLSPLEDFNQQYNKMATETPEKYFRVFKNPGLNGPAFRAKLWSFVGYMGENYGYSDGENIYHRRASLVMPKIKITKAPVGVNMMYHTHPRKDEPSLSSPDDYLLYFDLSLPPRSIRHFYTCMADRMDYFHIVPKKDVVGKFVRISEDKFIQELDDQMGVFEKKHDAKFQKGTKEDNLRYCEAITKDVVNWLNKKYGSYVTIKYKCYYKVRKNPPEPEFADLHLGDEFIAKAIQDIRDSEYSWPEFETDKKPHENYAYWFIQYYFMEDDKDRQLELLTGEDKRQSIQWAVKHRSRELGIQSGRLTVINHYLDALTHPEYTNYDLLNLLTLHYDIAIGDEGIRDGSGYKSRIQDLAREMELPEDVKDDLIVIEEARMMGAYTEEAKTLSGDFYPLLILANLAIEAIQIMKSVTNGLMTLEQAKHDVYYRKKDKALGAIDQFLIDYQNNYNRNEREILGLQIPAGFKGARLNPSPSLAKTDFSASIPKEDLLMTDIVIEALEKFAPYDTGNVYFDDVRSKLYMKVPGGGTTVKVGLSLTTGNMQIFVPAKGHPQPEDPSLAAMEAYEEIVSSLNEYGLNISNDDLEVATMTAANPRGKSQLILIAGPSGAGKSTTIRNLLQALPKSKTVPSYTTRQKRKSDKPGEKVFVTEKKFKQMEANNEFAESVRQKNGNYYGRRFVDFNDADYLVIDASLSGINRFKKLYPGAYSVYLETTATPEQVYQTLLRRGQMSPQEARKRSSIIPTHIRDSKKMSFDKRVVSIMGKYNDIALEILEEIPRNNPNIYYNAHMYASGSKDPFFPGDVPVAPPDLLRGNPPWKESSQENPYIMLTEPWSNIKVPIDERLAPLVQHLWNKNVPTSYSDQGIGQPTKCGYLVIRWPYDYAKPILDKLAKEGNVYFDSGGIKLWAGGDRVFPENSIAIRWGTSPRGEQFTKIDGETALKAIYKGFGLTYPSSREAALKQVESIKLNPSQTYTTKFDFVPGKEYTFDELPGEETGRIIKAFEEDYGPLGTSLSEDALHHFRSKEGSSGGYGLHGRAEDATYRALIVPNEKLVKQFGHLKGKPSLQKHIEQHGLDYPSIGNEGNNRRIAMAKLGRDMPHLEVIPAKQNPPKLTVRIEESTNPEKKLMAVFTKPNGRTKTTHFGARGMSDYTQHKDPSRKDNYLARHGGMGENWKDPTTAGALSRWILWGKPSLRESFNDYKKKFKIEGVMAVTNTRMNPKDCPPATQDLKLNTKNRDSAIAAEHIQYGPLNLSDEDYWVRYGKKWNTSGEIAKNSNCGNCVAFDTSPRMEECMPLELDNDGRLGYCWMHHFKCHSARTCYTWAAGGPITNDKQSMDNQARAFSKPNPKAPGYNSYAWTTQDWRSIKVNNKGEVDYAKKCGAEDTQVADGTPRLCLPAEVVKKLIRSDKGKEVLLTQARKKARAAKGTRIPWHPMIKKIWKGVEDKTVKDRPNPPIPFGPRPNPEGRHGKMMSEEEDPFADQFRD